MASGTPPDAALARRCRAGEPAAWNELVQRFTPLCWRLALRMLRDRAEAEDACQEAFVRVVRSFDSYDPTRPMGPWVGRIAYHVCLKRLGNKTRQRTEVQDALLLGERTSADGPGPEAGAAASEAGALLESALAELPAQDRALVTMRYREELSEAEMSEVTGMPVNTVKTRLHRARARLRALLQPVLGPWKRAAPSERSRPLPGGDLEVGGEA
ncbi:MAG TPA: sigma-70 family RNA polymerase sigma factor [Myxococcota bacterium]|nr:sigma-70 family RNA polymerase sigma factor [Myxococcota bacterium]HRY92735.1 sigma-70 family RNA polymerase sigma factor [Myxococcota bacterium]HSA20723.1 sigma-70 family RNA polymerase sigma factor [Myxococcota bacterium]